MKIVFLKVFFLSLFSSSFLLGVEYFNLKKNVTTLKKDVMVNPFQYETITSHSRDKMFLLKNESQVFSDNNIESLIKKAFTNGHLSLNKYTRDPSLSLLSSQTHLETYTIHFGGVPFCQSEIKVISSFESIPLVLGEVPVVNFDEIPASKWPDPYATTKKILNFLVNEDFDIDNFIISSKNKCYLERENQVVPVWNLTIKNDNLPYHIIANHNSIFLFEKKFFSLEEEVSGQTQVFHRNRESNQLLIHNLNFLGNGKLESKFFSTHTNKNTKYGFPRAFSLEHSFIYDPEDYRFSEASVFTNASLMQEYFQNIGYKWDEKSLVLNIHAQIGASESINNALYIPVDDQFNFNPSINLGDGDGRFLKDLLIDSDVISHELGHHIIYKNLKSTSGESLVLHEGIADYFAFAYSQDTCLGETICPENSDACYLKNKCLRSADNNLNYQSKTYRNLGPHHQGQLISSVLWELRSTFDSSYFDKLVLRSLDYLLVDSGFYHFILALLKADEELGGGIRKCMIFTAMTMRGFDRLLEDLECKNLELWPDEKESTPIIVEEENVVVDSKSTKKNIFCGTIGMASSRSFNLIEFFLIFMFIPLVVLRLSLKSTKEKQIKVIGFK